MTKPKAKEQTNNRNPIVRPKKYLSRDGEWLILNFQTFTSLIKVSDIRAMLAQEKKR